MSMKNFGTSKTGPNIVRFVIGETQYMSNPKQKTDGQSLGLREGQSLALSVSPEFVTLLPGKFAVGASA